MEYNIQQKAPELKSLTDNVHATLSLNVLSAILQTSEYDLIGFMVKQNVWQGPVPPPPSDSSTLSTIEFGLMLYWLHNPQLIVNDDLKFAANLINGLFPEPQMTDENYQHLCTNEYVYDDGSIISTRNYATYDQGWFTSFFNLLQSITYNLWYNGNTFPMPVLPQKLALHGAAANKVTIAMVGDWGTGDATAAAVMQQIISLQPDYIIHLGDVYYSGSPTGAYPYSHHYFSQNEELNNLMKAWPSSYAGKSFTLNSNHEMYSGANGYFLDALKAAGTPFSAQAGVSCFALQFGGWTILGLDSAYMGTSADAFMEGFIGGANGTQGAWIQGLNLDPDKTIVLTHHTGFAYDCSAVNLLWSEIKGALKKDPYAWYWGHVHNGIIYNSPVKITSGNNHFQTNTLARCIGHGALPYGFASALENNSNIAWQANSRQQSSHVLYNGFAMLTLEANDKQQMVRITEDYYDLSSSGPVKSAPVYTAAFVTEKTEG